MTVPCQSLLSASYTSTCRALGLLGKSFTAGNIQFITMETKGACLDYNKYWNRADPTGQRELPPFQQYHGYHGYHCYQH